MAIALQHAPPAQVVLQMLGRHPMKAPHPLLEATVVGIDILDMEGAINDPDTLLDIDGAMGQAQITSYCLIRAIAFEISTAEFCISATGLKANADILSLKSCSASMKN